MSLNYVISLTDNFSKGFDNLDKKISSAGKSMQSVGSTMTKSVTAPLLAMGGAMFAAANTFDKASKTMRAGTGATGDELQALEANFRNVFRGVPQSADEVATAIADINTRTGLAGEPLQALSKQMLDLARISGSEVAPLVAATTRVFGDWDVASEDMSGTLDKLWKVSQTTGIGVDDLSQKVVQSGAVFRQLGYTLDESSALLGKFEQEGVNTETILAGLKMGLSSMAKAGKEPAREFPKLIARIQDAGDMATATSIAMETFGSRAGPDMAAAILEGRFEIADLMATLEASGETVEKAGQDTLTFGERVGIMKNNVMTAIAPIGAIMLDLVDDKIDPLITKINELADWFEELSPKAQMLALGIGTAAAAFGPLLWVAGALAGAFTSIMVIVGPLATRFGALTGLSAIGPIGWTIVAVLAALTAAFVIAWKYSETFRKFVMEAWEKVKESASKAWDIIKPILETFGAFMLEKFRSVYDWVMTNWPLIKETIVNAMQSMWDFVKPVVTEVGSFIAEVFGKIYDWTIENWPLIKDTIVAVATDIWEVIEWAFTSVWDSLKEVYAWIEEKFILIWPALELAIKLTWEAIKATVRNAIDIVLGVLKTLMQLITGDFSGAWKTIEETVDSVIGNIRQYVETGFGIVGDFIGGIMDGIGTKVSEVFNGMKDTIKSTINSVISSINRFIGSINGLKISVPAVEIPLLGKVGGFTVGMPQIPKVPSLAIGTDRILSDGLVEAHAGESIVPAKVTGGGYSGGNGSAPTINIYADVVDGDAFQRFAQRISRELAYDVGGAR